MTTSTPSSSTTSTLPAPSTALPLAMHSSEFIDPELPDDTAASQMFMARIRRPTLLRRPYLKGPSKILTPFILEHLWHWLPSKWASARPEMLFSTDVDGYSLTTLLNRCGASARTYLLIRTSQGKIFGAYLPSPWQRASTKLFYGTSESFVFSFAESPPRAYPWSLGNQDFFISTSDRHLCIGGDAIWLDKDLSHGFTSASKTFKSPPLDGGSPQKSIFQCINLEIIYLNDKIQS